MRGVIQKAATTPMLYGATRHAHAGCGMAVRRMSHRATAMILKIAAMKRSWPISTPTLKTATPTELPSGQSNAFNAPAKPNPCNNPKVNATIHGQRSVQPASPGAHEQFPGDEHDAQRNRLDRRSRHMHEAERRARERDPVRNGERGHRATRRRVPFTRIISPRINSRWSTPHQMWSMPRRRYAPATPNHVCDAAI